MEFVNPLGGDIQPFAGKVSYSPQPHIATLADGTFLFVSGAYPNEAPTALLAQHYNGAGQAMGDPFALVSDYQLSFQSLDATGLADGGVALVFQTYDPASGEFSNWVQSFDADGTARGDRVAAFGDLGPDFITDAQIAALPGGGFMAAAAGRLPSGAYDMLARGFDASGAALGATGQYGSRLSVTQRLVNLNPLEDGTVMATWQESDLFGLHFGAGATPLGDVFLISPSGSSNNSTGIGEGNMLAVWNTYNGDEFDIFGRIMSPEGAAVTDTFRINSTTAEDQIYPVAASLSDGSAVVAWIDESGPDKDIRAQRIGPDGARIGEEFRANADMANDQESVQIAVLDNDRVVIAWVDAFDSAEAREKLSEMRLFNTELSPAAPITGTSGADTLNGTDGDDEMLGLAGADVLRGMGGDDTLEGGDGPDTLNGGDGNDLIRGGETEADKRDVIYGGAGNDSIDGGHGNDLVYGQGGNDTIAGGFGADELQGQDGDDVITGSAFGDIVFGNAGNDFVNGGFGHDLINGGSGADKFFHTGGTAEQMEGHGSDWVQDYSATEGDVLVFGGTATASQFQVNFTHTANKETGERSGDDDVQEAFVIYKPTGQILWALVDGGGEASINLQIGAEVFDLLG